MVNVNTLSCQSRQEVIKLNLVKKGTLPGTRTGMAVSVFRKHSTLSKRESSVWRLTLNINTSDTGPHSSPAGPPSAPRKTDASCSGSRCSLEAGETESSETGENGQNWQQYTINGEQRWILEIFHYGVDGVRIHLSPAYPVDF